MASAPFHAAAISFAVTGLILIFAAAVSPVWMEGCLSFDSIFTMMGKLTGSSDQKMPAVDQSLAQLKGRQMCIRQGLFRISMDVGGIASADLPIDVSALPQYVFFACLGLGVGMIFTVTAIVLLIIAAKGSSDSYETKARVAMRTRRAIILLGVAVLLTTAGMGVYTGGAASSVHNSLNFLGQFGAGGASSISHMFGGAGMNHGGDYNLNIPGRKKRQLDAGAVDIKKLGEDVLKGMDPNYGYSFILGWVSVAILVISLVLAVIAKQYLLQDPYAGASMSL